MSDLNAINQTLTISNQEQKERDSTTQSRISESRDRTVSALKDIKESLTGVKNEVSTSSNETQNTIQDNAPPPVSNEEKNEGRRFLKATFEKIAALNKGLGDTIKKGFSKGKDELGAFLLPAISLIKGILIGGLVFIFLKKLPDILNSPLFEEIIKVMQNKIIPALSYLYNTFILPFARAIGEGLTNLFRDINDESLSAFDVLKRNFGFLTASIGAIALLLYPKKVLGLLKFAARKFGLNIGKAGKDVDDVAKRMGGAGKGKRGIKGLLGGVTRFGGAIARFAGPIGLAVTAATGITGGLTAASEKLKEGGSAGEALSAGVGGFVETLSFGLFSGERIAGGLNKFGDSVKAGFSKMGSNISMMADNAGPIINNMKETLGQKFEELKSNAMPMIESLGSRLKDALESFKSKLGGFKDKVVGFFKKDEEKVRTDPFQKGETFDTSGASIVEEEKRGFFGSLKKHLKVGGETFVKDMFPKAQDFKLFDSAAQKIREDKKIQKQELMDAAYGAANREEFAKQVAAGVLATQGALSVDESRRANFTSQEVDELASAGIDVDKINNLALTNELLKARAAEQVSGNNISTNVVDNSNSTTMVDNIILDPRVNDYNFMTSAASDY